MKLTSEEKKDILNFVIKQVTSISNQEYQRRVWIRGEGPEVDDFDETTCHFLHEGGGVLNKYQDFELTTSQYKQLKKLRDEFKVFSDENEWPQLFIDTPEWKKITEMAQEVLQAFNYKKTN